MGFPNLLHLTRTLISLFLQSIGLADFLKPDTSNTVRLESLSSTLIRELLPVTKFSASDPSENCTVCLYDFTAGDEIRCLPNCRHVFHRSCLDRWMDHDHLTCPLCRTQFVPDDLPHVFNERLWTATGMFDFCSDY